MQSVSSETEFCNSIQTHTSPSPFIHKNDDEKVSQNNTIKANVSLHAPSSRIPYHFGIVENHPAIESTSHVVSLSILYQFFKL